MEPLIISVQQRLGSLRWLVATMLYGAILFGVVGLLLAVPIAVCIKITLQQYSAEPIKSDEPG